MASKLKTRTRPEGEALSLRRRLQKAEEHLRARRFGEAEREYTRCLEIGPANAEANYQLGLLASKSGSPSAVDYLVSALRSAPHKPHYWVSAATAMLAADQPSEARRILERFLSQPFPEDTKRRLVSPVASVLLSNAKALFDQRQFQAAEIIVDIAILLDDSSADAIRLAGSIADVTGRHDSAIELFGISIGIDKCSAASHAGLGVALLNLSRKTDACAAFEKAIELDAGNVEAHIALSDLNRQRGRLQDSLTNLQDAIALRPDAFFLQGNLGVLLLELGRAAEAATVMEAVLAADPAAAQVQSNLAQTRLYLPDIAGEIYMRTARAYGSKHADHLLRKRPFANDRTLDRRIRVGFVSSDLHDHPVSCFVEPFLEHHDRSLLEIFAYAAGVLKDATTERLRAHVHAWRDISGLDDDAAADLVEQDGIDVLVDLSSHSAGHRLLLFARKPAPIQATWIGMPASTGLAAMDYRLTDGMFDPLGTERDLETEQLWRIPGAAYCYRPHEKTPDVPALAPRARNGHVTFGCFNRIEKVGDAALAAWSKILSNVGNARLLLVVADIIDPRRRTALERRLLDAGIDVGRIEFAPRRPENRNSLYPRVDVALDPFPFNGGTTSMDTLFMGVPFVTLEGDSTVSRMGAAILRRIGLPELVAGSEDEYVDIASRLGADPTAMDRNRFGLRERLIGSPHMDYRGHARDVSDAFCGMWSRWCVRDS